VLGLNKYILGGCVALALFCVTLIWRLDMVTSQRDVAREAARVNAATVATLQAETERVDIILTALRDTQTVIRQDSERTRRALVQAEQSNEEIRFLLDTHIPDNLASVLWDDASNRNHSIDAAKQSNGVVQGDGP
jgi:hypothetical protein